MAAVETRKRSSKWNGGEKVEEWEDGRRQTQIMPMLISITLSSMSLMIRATCIDYYIRNALNAGIKPKWAKL